MRGLDAARKSDEVAQGRGRVRADRARIAFCDAHRPAHVIVRMCHIFLAVACRVVLFCRDALMHRPVMVSCAQESSFSMLPIDLNGNNKFVFSVSYDENGEITQC